VRPASRAAAHPNVVHIYDVGIDEDGRPFIAMEFVDGETLAELLVPPRPLRREEVRRSACRPAARSRPRTRRDWCIAT